MAIREIIITLWKNSDGLTLSVLPNSNYGGKVVNFSFKGDNTLNYKAVNDNMSNMSDALRQYFVEQKQNFRPLFEDKDRLDELRFSKGYLQGPRGRKGKTVPAFAALMREQDQWVVKLNIAGDDYMAQLDPDELTDNQSAGGAIAGHRALPGVDKTDYDDDFMGDAND